MLPDLSGFSQGDERSNVRRDADVVNDDSAGGQSVEDQPYRPKLRRGEVWRRLDEIDERKHVRLKHHLILGREPLRFLVASAKNVDLERSSRDAEAAEGQPGDVSIRVDQFDREVDRSRILRRRASLLAAGRTA